MCNQRAAVTPRELEVMRAKAQGLADKEVADQLHISTSTAKNHSDNVRRKTGQPSTLRALLFLGLLVSAGAVLTKSDKFRAPRRPLAAH